MADKDDLEDWDPKSGTTVAKRPTPRVPAGSPRQGIPVREISPSDVNLGGGSRMIGRTPTYNRGGAVKLGSPKVSAPCKDTKTIKCYT